MVPEITLEYIDEEWIRITYLAVEDPAAAHIAEDKLWENILWQIAVGVPNPTEYANAALHTKEIEFTRWYA